MNTRTLNRTDLAAKLVLGFALLSIGVAVYAAPSQTPPGLFKESHMPAHPQLPPNAKAGKSRFVQMDPAQLQSDRLVLNLLDNESFTAKRKRWVENANGSKVWLGGIEGVEDAEVSLATYGKAVAGTIRIGKKMYAVRYSGDGIQSLSEVGASEPLPELDPVPTGYDTTSGTTGGSSTSTPTGSGDTGEVMDVMVVYTPASRVAHGGSDGIQALIALAVAESNQAYLNSGVSTSLRLAHSAEVSYTESGSMSTDLSRLYYPADGFMDEVNALRDAYAADLVSLIEESNEYCGVGYQMTNEGAAFESNAFSVVASQCATGYYSFGHELGHNMGLTHDHFSARTSAAYPYSYGYWAPSMVFRTIMAYQCPGSCPRVQHFSNPLVMYAGLPTGIDYAVDPANAADNALTLSQTVATVAGFRESSLAGPPAAPADLRAFTTAEDRIELSWTDSSSTESGYLIERSEDGATFVQIASLARNSASFADTGLAPATNYSYRAKAYNPAGDSAPSNLAEALTPDPSLAIDQPSDGEMPLSGVVSGDYSLTWTADGSAESIQEVTSGGKPASRYSFLEHTWVFDLQPASIQVLDALAWTQAGATDSFTFAYSTDGSSFTDMFAVGASDSGATSFTLPAGTSGRVYVRVVDNMRIAGVTSANSIYIDQLLVRSMSVPGSGPLAPSSLTATPVASDSIALSWTDNAANELGFRIESSADGNTWSWLANVDADEVGYVDAGLPPSSARYYRVSAFNEGGVSEAAGPVSASTPAAPGIPLVVTQTKVKGKSQADLAWNGASTASVDVYRDGSVLAVATPNDGSFTDPLQARSGSFLYRVCEGGSATVCSEEVMLSF